MNDMFNQIATTSTGFAVILIILTLAVLSWVFATTANEHLAKNHPNALPFRWGYFYGIFGLMLYLLLIGSNVALYTTAVSMSIEFTAAAMYLLVIQTTLAIINVVAHVMLLKRNRWGFVVATILSINVIIYIVNAFYIKKRWAELKKGEKACS